MAMLHDVGIRFSAAYPLYNTSTMTSLRTDFSILAVSVAAGILFFTFTGQAFAQTGGTATTTPSGTSLGVTLNATPRVAPGTNDALLALVILTTGSGNSVQISSLPVSTTFGNGAMTDQTSDCRVRNVLSLATPLTTTGTNLASGQTTFNFSPLTINAGSTVTLALTCDIAARAPAGGTIMPSLTPSQISATVSGGGTSVTPIVGPSLTGGTGPTSGTVTLTPGVAVTPPLIPGVPNTGTGSYLLVLAGSAMLAIGGAMLLRRRFA